MPEGVKANVLFFDRLPERSASSGHLWVYDFRSDNRYSLKTRPLKHEDLNEFVKSFRADRRLTRSESQNLPRWRSFAHAEIRGSEDCRLDPSWELEVAPERVPGSNRLNEIADLIQEELLRALSLTANFTRGRPEQVGHLSARGFT